MEASQQRLHEAQTANRRLQMLVGHLKTELDRAADQLNGLRSAEVERDELKRKLERAQSELSAAECRRRTDVERLDAEWTKTLEEQRLADTAVQARLGADVARLEQKVGGLERELRREREEHCRTREGLEHLRVHFSSTLSTAGEKLNCVHKDELDNWNY